METLEKSRKNCVYYGSNLKKDLQKLLNRHNIRNTKILLVTGINSFDKSDYKRKFEYVCKKQGINVIERIRVSPNPFQGSLKRLMKNSKKNLWIFCIGGGSAIDYGKLFKLKKYPDAKIFVLYTLPGSGSIVTPFAIYNNDEFKIGVHSNDIVPNVVYVNEKIFSKLNNSFKLLAICDIFAHAFESSLSKISNAQSRRHSETALEILLKNGPDPRLIKPRDIIVADLNAAKAESKALVLFPHAIGHYLTYKFKIPHPVASILYQKKFAELLIINKYSLKDGMISYLETLEQLLKDYNIYPKVLYVNAKEALVLIKKYMDFTLKNAPIKIRAKGYINLINSLKI